MSQGPLRQDAFEQLEAYVLGTMEADQRRRFEQRLAEDAELRNELELGRENIRAVEMAGVERTLKTLRAGHGAGSTEAGSRWAPLLKYAAMLALLLGAGIWWAVRPSAHERVFAQYYHPDPGLPVPMSVVKDPEFQDAMVAYKLEDYAEAVAKWEPLLQTDPDNDTLQFYIASALLAQGRAADAAPRFDRVASNTASAFQAKARWFLYLAYLRSGNREAMRHLGMTDDPVYGERAREIERQYNP
ncbi:MAG: hypothetical protein J5I62_12170 [Flavobacteriales bacterium]|nr:hypothetical protein [Flavobacteriales bacterium]MEB2342032.1 hypothetical protein [Flavobacteriia bacterium]